MNDRVEIVEVGARDGLQSQPVALPTAGKLELIRRLVDAGLRRIEVASFVNPKRVPQMADAEEVVRTLPEAPGVQYIGLVLNERGLERALDTGIHAVNCVVSATDSFGRRNQGASIEESLETATRVLEGARSAGRAAGVTISVAFGCPFEGEVPGDRVVDLAQRLAARGYGEIAIADTIGAAAPSDVARLVPQVQAVLGDARLRCHFHDTRNTGVANAYAALAAGVRILDSSCGGLGGCPFAPAATGNVATEDLLYMIHRMGFATGVDLQKIIDTAHWLEGPLNMRMPAMLSRAGVFPRPAVLQS